MQDTQDTQDLQITETLTAWLKANITPISTPHKSYHTGEYASMFSSILGLPITHIHLHASLKALKWKTQAICRTPYMYMGISGKSVLQLTGGRYNPARPTGEA